MAWGISHEAGNNPEGVRVCVLLPTPIPTGHPRQEDGAGRLLEGKEMAPKGTLILD